MGCGHSRTIEEDFIEEYFSSLDIRNHQAHLMGEVLVKIRKDYNSLEAFAERLQKDYFATSNYIFADVTLFKDFLMKYKDKEKYILMAFLLLCKRQSLCSEKLAKAFNMILNAYGHKDGEIIDENFMCKADLIKEVLTIYVHLVTDFSAKYLADFNDAKETFLKKLLPAFSKDSQRMFVRHHLAIEEKKPTDGDNSSDDDIDNSSENISDKNVCLMKFNYMLEELDEANVRDRLVAMYQDKRKIEKKHKENVKNEIKKAEEQKNHWETLRKKKTEIIAASRLKRTETKNKEKENIVKN